MVESDLIKARFKKSILATASKLSFEETRTRASQQKYPFKGFNVSFVQIQISEDTQN